MFRRVNKGCILKVIDEHYSKEKVRLGKIFIDRLNSCSKTMVLTKDIAWTSNAQIYCINLLVKLGRISELKMMCPTLNKYIHIIISSLFFVYLNKHAYNITYK